MESVHNRYVTGLRPLLVTITLAAALMLIIVCANVAVLMLLRAARQQREVSVRVALGAGRREIFRMLVTDSLLICTAAFLLGMSLTRVTLQLLAPMVEEHLGRPAPGGASSIGLDPTVLVAIGGAGILIALSLSLFPLLAPWQRKLAEILRRDLRTGTDGPHMRRIRSSLVAFEIAGSLALLVGCGLMIRSALNLVRTDLGFNIENVVRARVALPQRSYPDARALLGFYERLMDALATRSNANIAMTNWPPFYAPPLQRLETGSGINSGIEVGVSAVGPDYFSIRGIPVISGRPFSRSDRTGAEPVALVSHALARQLWPDGIAVGQQIRTGEFPAARSPLGAWRTVVGVIKDVRQNHTDTDLKDIYIPFLQAPNPYSPLFIRSDRPATAWLTTLRESVGEIDPNVLVSGVMLLRDEGDRLVAPTRFLTSVLSGFAVFATLVAILGIHGITAYAAQQREREVAIRLAMGASRRAIVGLFLKQSLVVLTAGIVVGLIAATAIARILQNQLYRVEPFDAWTLLAASALMAGTALAATCVMRPIEPVFGSIPASS